MSNSKYFPRRNFIKTSALSCGGIWTSEKMTRNPIVGDKSNLSVPVPLSHDNNSILNPIDLSPARWKKYNLKPYSVKNFKISNDKNFVEK